MSKVVTCLVFLIFLFGEISLGQNIHWAEKVIAFSSEYKDSSNVKSYRASRVLGAPDVLPAVENNPCAWSPKWASKGMEWIEVGYEGKVSVNQVVVGQSYNPGAISAIYLYSVNGSKKLIYPLKSTKVYNPYPGSISFLLSSTIADVKKVRVELNTKKTIGWNHIDAIGLSSSKSPYVIGIQNPSKSVFKRIERLSVEVNTQFDELLPIISPDGSTLFFSRRGHPENVGGYSFQGDIWYSHSLKSDGWEHSEHMPYPINNTFNNYVCGVLPGTNTLLLANVYHDDQTVTQGVSTTTKSLDGWSFPQPLYIEGFYNNNHHAEYAISLSGRVLVMALQRNESVGGRDLYVSFKLNDGIWSTPVHMGNAINSIADEVTPFIAPDESRIYFASDGFSGYGDMDIYVSYRKDESWQRWTEPINLGSAINSPDFDASFSMDASGQFGFFTTYSKGLDESSDIFKVELPPSERPKPVLMLRGYILNSKTGEALQAEVIYEDLDSGIELGRLFSNPKTGAYQITIPNNTRVGIRAKAEGFLSVNENLEVEGLSYYKELKKELQLIPIEIGQSVRLNNLFFQRGTADIKKESFFELDRIVQTMIDYPNIEIQLEGHTDIGGSPIENMRLSEQRVNRVKDYLVQRGIYPERVLTKAYGSTKPVSRKDDEKSRSMNRRVEFKILKL